METSPTSRTRCRRRYRIRAALIALAFVIGWPAAAFSAGPRLHVAFADPGWDGRRVPSGQQCAMFGGGGATPALKVENIPAGADTILVEFNDRDYEPLSYDGGHGVIGFKLSGGGRALLPSVPAATRDAGKLPAGAFVAEDNRATGRLLSDGYLPPCSGGRDHRYFAVVKAMGGGEVLATGRIELGRY